MASTEAVQTNDLGSSLWASRKAAAKRSRHVITVGRLTDSRREISLIDSAAAVGSTMRALTTTLCPDFRSS